MANGVDAAVNGMQPPRLQPPLNRVFTQAECDELGTPNHAMLAPCELGDRPIHGVLRNLTAHNAVK